MRKETDLRKVYQAVLDNELEITPQGEIWRIAKRGRNKAVKCKRVRAEHDTGAYLAIHVMFNRIRLTTGAHRLIYYHFNGDIPSGMTVNHKNGNKKDNNPNNLELMTHKEQMRHARTVLKIGIRQQDGEKNLMSKLTEAQVSEIILRRKNGEKLKEISRDYDISPKYVSELARGKYWKKIFGDSSR